MSKINTVRQVNWEVEKQKYIVSKYNSPYTYFIELGSVEESLVRSGGFADRVKGWKEEQAAYRAEIAQAIKEENNQKYAIDAELLMEAKKAGYELLAAMINELKETYTDIKEMREKLKALSEMTDKNSKEKNSLKKEIAFFLANAETIRKNINQIKLELGEPTNYSKVTTDTPVALILNELSQLEGSNFELDDIKFHDPPKELQNNTQKRGADTV